MKLEFICALQTFKYICQVPAEVLEDVKRKAAKDVEDMVKKLEEAESARDRAERSRRKLQNDVR